MVSTAPGLILRDIFAVKRILKVLHHMKLHSHIKKSLSLPDSCFENDHNRIKLHYGEEQNIDVLSELDIFVTNLYDLTHIVQK